jgi:hypothetical protein
MRTTVELPPSLLREAKARAAQRGETLKTLLTRAVATELGQAADRRDARARVALPLLGEAGATPLHLSAADLERALADVDALRAGRRRPRRRR